MRMKRLLTLALVVGVCLAIAPLSLAIEKHKKDTPPAKRDTTTVAKPQPQAQPQAGKMSDTLKTTKQRRTPPVFNDFIDVNRNGIDDRLEQGGYFVPPKQVPKTPAVTKKTDGTKTVLPKPAADSSAKKGK
jgi:hypothetical protein